METTTLEFRAKETEAIETLRTAYTPESGNGGFNPFPYFIFLLAILAIAWGMGAFGGGTPTTPQTETETQEPSTYIAPDDAHTFLYDVVMGGKSIPETEDDLTLARQFFKDIANQRSLKHLSAVLRLARTDNGINGRFIQFLKSKKGDKLILFLGRILAERIRGLRGLPSAYVLKQEAKDNGWDPRINYVSDVMPGNIIGGDEFFTDDCNLPKEALEQCNGIGGWKEADLFYIAGKRGAWRLVYNVECGKYFVTKNHYREFTEVVLN